MPLVVAGAIAAGGAIAGGVIGSKSAKSAAKTQTQAADRSAQLQYDLGMQGLDFQRQMWDQGRADMQPWMNMGKSALGALGSGMGLSGGPASMGGGGMSLGNPRGSLYKAPQMVMMRAPDGSTRPVPRTMVPHYQSRGAQVVG